MDSSPVSGNAPVDSGTVHAAEKQMKVITAMIEKVQLQLNDAKNTTSAEAPAGQTFVEASAEGEAGQISVEHLYEQGYKLALEHGPFKFPRGAVSTYFVHGFECGMRELNKQLPNDVHNQLNIIHAVLQHYGQAEFQMQLTTTPLISSGRRAVHILMKGAVAENFVKIQTLGQKTEKWRRMRLQVTSTPAQR